MRSVLSTCARYRTNDERVSSPILCVHVDDKAHHHFADPKLLRTMYVRAQETGHKGPCFGFPGAGLLRTEFINIPSLRRAFPGGIGRDDRFSVVNNQRTQLVPKVAT
jgi:hypothetical protein